MLLGKCVIIISVDQQVRMPDVKKVWKIYFVTICNEYFRFERNLSYSAFFVVKVYTIVITHLIFRILYEADHF